MITPEDVVPPLPNRHIGHTGDSHNSAQDDGSTRFPRFPFTEGMNGRVCLMASRLIEGVQTLQERLERFRYICDTDGPFHDLCAYLLAFQEYADLVREKEMDPPILVRIGTGVFKDVYTSVEAWVMRDNLKYEAGRALGSEEQCDAFTRAVEAARKEDVDFYEHILALAKASLSHSARADYFAKVIDNQQVELDALRAVLRFGNMMDLKGDSVPPKTKPEGGTNLANGATVPSGCPEVEDHAAGQATSLPNAQEGSQEESKDTHGHKWKA